MKKKSKPLNSDQKTDKFKEPHNAYASWADENYVVSDTEFAFTNLKDEDVSLDLHEKMTHFVSKDTPMSDFPWGKD